MWIRHFILVGCSLAMQGCSLSSMNFTSPITEPAINMVTISAASQANNNSPVAVDLVVAFDEELVTVLQKMKARDYFTQKEQLKRDHPTNLEIFHWEVTPGQVLLQEHVSHSFSPKGAFIFADYLAPGDYRFRVGDVANVILKLEPDHVLVEKAPDFEENPKS